MTLSSIHTRAHQLGEILLTRHWRLSVAESCTGGTLCGAITDIPGCSYWFDRGFITYSNDAKADCLGVQKKTIKQHGAVSEQTAIAMTTGVLTYAKQSQLSIAITGIAGPEGGSDLKPVGTVWIACASIEKLPLARAYLFVGNRPAIRHQAVSAALDLLIEYCS
ncbi:MAG: hypothetical protein B7X00_01030 [Legionella sp. 21-45-4]|nr:MAG: hypothetical protein B7X00_01030 [Legionella sp. 21-45-4]